MAKVGTHMKHSRPNIRCCLPATILQSTVYHPILTSQPVSVNIWHGRQQILIETQQHSLMKQQQLDFDKRQKVLHLLPEINRTTLTLSESPRAGPNFQYIFITHK